MLASGWMERDGALSAHQQRVLAAATELFAERGYLGASTAEIAARAHVAEATIFKRYRTKRDLLLAVLEPFVVRIGEPGMGAILQSALDAPRVEVAAVLRDLAHDRLAFVAAHPAVARILLQELPFNPDLRARLVTMVAADPVPGLVRLVTRLQREGQIDPALPPATVIRTLMGAVAIYVLQRVFLSPDGAWDDRAEIDRIATVLARGLAPAPAPD